MDRRKQGTKNKVVVEDSSPEPSPRPTRKRGRPTAKEEPREERPAAVANGAAKPPAKKAKAAPKKAAAKATPKKDKAPPKSKGKGRGIISASKGKKRKNESSDDSSESNFSDSGDGHKSSSESSSEEASVVDDGDEDLEVGGGSMDDVGDIPVGSKRRKTRSTGGKAGNEGGKTGKAGNEGGKTGKPRSSKRAYTDSSVEIEAVIAERDVDLWKPWQPSPYFTSPLHPQLATEGAIEPPTCSDSYLLDDYVELTGIPGIIRWAADGRIAMIRFDTNNNTNRVSVRVNQPSLARTSGGPNCFETLSIPFVKEDKEAPESETSKVLFDRGGFIQDGGLALHSFAARCSSAYEDEFVAVEWSPPGCAWDGGSLLAVLDCKFRLRLHEPPRDAQSCLWPVAASISTAAVNHTQEDIAGARKLVRKTQNFFVGERCRTLCMEWMPNLLLGKGGAILATAGHVRLSLWQVLSAADGEVDVTESPVAFMDHPFFSTPSAGYVCKVAWGEGGGESGEPVLLAIATTRGAVAVLGVTFSTSDDGSLSAEIKPVWKVTEGDCRPVRFMAFAPPHAVPGSIGITVAIGGMVAAFKMESERVGDAGDGGGSSSDTGARTVTKGVSWVAHSKVVTSLCCRSTVGGQCDIISTSLDGTVKAGQWPFGQAAGGEDITCIKGRVVIQSQQPLLGCTFSPHGIHMTLVEKHSASMVSTTANTSYAQTKPHARIRILPLCVESDATALAEVVKLVGPDRMLTDWSFFFLGGAAPHPEGSRTRARLVAEAVAVALREEGNGYRRRKLLQLLQTCLYFICVPGVKCYHEHRPDKFLSKEERRAKAKATIALDRYQRQLELTRALVLAQNIILSPPSEENDGLDASVREATSALFWRTVDKSSAAAKAETQAPDSIDQSLQLLISHIQEVLPKPTETSNTHTKGSSNGVAHEEIEQEKCPICDKRVLSVSETSLAHPPLTTKCVKGHALVRSADTLKVLRGKTVNRCTLCRAAVEVAPGQIDTCRLCDFFMVTEL